MKYFHSQSSKQTNKYFHSHVRLLRYNLFYIITNITSIENTCSSLTKPCANSSHNTVDCGI